MDQAVYFPLVAMLVIATITDLRHRLIHDWLTLPGIVYFFAFHLFVQPKNFSIYFWGFILLGGISYVLAIISVGKLGGGDIKLYALIGSALGWRVGLTIFATTYVVAGLFALPVLLYKRIKPQATLPTELPMAPFILIATSVVLISFCC